MKQFPIKEIVQIESEWMNDLTQKYPHTFKRRASNFENYLSCELETYSDETIEFYFKDIKTSKDKGENLAEERYTHLFQGVGYNSITEVEENRLSYLMLETDIMESLGVTNEKQFNELRSKLERQYLDQQDRFKE